MTPVSDSEQFDTIQEDVKRLHALGCRLAIDDYGTGYSSLAYLRRLQVHELKIDKSFVIGMTGDESDVLIVRSTIDLAHNLGLTVVAEGVEDDPTLERLRGMGCDMVQGYLLSRALGVNEIDWNGDIKPGPLEIGFDYCFLIPATGDRVPCVYVENHREERDVCSRVCRASNSARGRAQFRIVILQTFT